MCKRLLKLSIHSDNNKTYSIETENGTIESRDEINCLISYCYRHAGEIADVVLSANVPEPSGSVATASVKSMLTSAV